MASLVYVCSAECRNHFRQQNAAPHRGASRPCGVVLCAFFAGNEFCIRQNPYTPPLPYTPRIEGPLDRPKSSLVYIKWVPNLLYACSQLRPDAPAQVHRRPIDESFVHGSATFPTALEALNMGPLGLGTRIVIGKLRVLCIYVFSCLFDTVHRCRLLFASKGTYRRQD